MADGLSCPFKDNTFDVVFHQGLLEHFNSPFRLLQENHRVLKKGGLLVVDVPQTLHIYTVIKQLLTLLGLWFAGWERQFTFKSLEKLLKQFGFAPLRYYGDWSRPGMIYRITREVLKRLNIELPMYPKFLGSITQSFYTLQMKMRRKKLLLYTVLSIGIIAKKQCSGSNRSLGGLLRPIGQ